MANFMNFEPELLDVSISLHAAESISEQICNRVTVNGINRIHWAIKALTMIDITTLAGDDTESNIARLCQTAALPLPKYILDHFDRAEDIHTAAVCVYPSRVKEAACQLGRAQGIKIAAVAGGFPSGQYSLESRLTEIKYALESGATEIDVVINRQLVLCERWEGVYEEILKMRKLKNGEFTLKVILAVGELGTLTNVYKAAMVAMMAGADFIKTSTGKETVNATLPVGLVMIYAIQNFRVRFKKNVGLKPAGGIRTLDDALLWMILVKETLGPDWLTPDRFRIGASGLLDDIEKEIVEYFKSSQSD